MGRRRGDIVVADIIAAGPWERLPAHHRKSQVSLLTDEGILARIAVISWTAP